MFGTDRRKPSGRIPLTKPSSLADRERVRVERKAAIDGLVKEAFDLAREGYLELAALRLERAIRVQKGGQAKTSATPLRGPGGKFMPFKLQTGDEFAQPLPQVETDFDALAEKELEEVREKAQAVADRGKQKLPPHREVEANELVKSAVKKAVMPDTIRMEVMGESHAGMSSQAIAIKDSLDAQFDALVKSNARGNITGRTEAASESSNRPSRPTAAGDVRREEQPPHDDFDEAVDAEVEKLKAQKLMDERAGGPIDWEKRDLELKKALKRANEVDDDDYEV